jgi:AraC-like DNA-binding protein
VKPRKMRKFGIQRQNINKKCQILAGSFTTSRQNEARAIENLRSLLYIIMVIHQTGERKRLEKMNIVLNKTDQMRADSKMLSSRKLPDTWKKIKVNFFWKYFLSFTLIFFVPTLLLSLLNFYFIRTHYANELIQKKQIELNNCGSTMSLLMTQVNNNIAELKNNSHFYTFSERDNTLDYFFEIRRQLQSSVLTNSYLSDIFFINEQRDSIHTSYEMTLLENFDFGQYGFSGLDNFKNILSGINTSLFLQTEKSGPIFVSPFQRNFSGGYYSYILYIFNTPALESILTPIIYLDNYFFTAYYYDSLILERGAYINESGNDIIINYGSEDDAVRLELRISTKYISRELQPLITMTYFLITIIILLSYTLIIYLTNKNYKPVQRLSKKVNEIISNPADSLNEFEAAEYALNYLTIDKNELFVSNKKLQRDHLLLKVLNGKYENNESFWVECRNAELFFNREFCSCYIISIHEPDIVFNEIIEAMKKIYNSEIYTLDLEYPENVILIVCSDDIKEIENRLNNEDNGILILKGIGKTVKKPGELSSSYHYARHHGKSRSYDIEAALPLDDLNALKNAIMIYDEEKILFFFDNLSDFIFDTDNFFFAACIYSHFLSNVNNALSDLDMKLNENFQPFFHQNLKSNEEILDKMNYIIDIILQFIEKQNSQIKKSNKNINDLTSFINENYTGHNFTVKSMADFFGVSVSNLSHYYKQKTGHTLTHYIMNLKIEHAKKLLKTTNMNLQSISAAAGYTQISAFIKGFKKITGMTPGEYRIQRDQ